MGAGDVLPDGDQPVRAEMVHESDRTRVTRVFLPGGTVIRKEPLGPDAQRRLGHERAILERLGGVPGVAQLAEVPGYAGSIVLADAGGRNLAGLAKPLAADDLAKLAAGLARAVAGIHRRGVMHRDIAPANVVLSRDGAPCLVGFSLATSLAEIRPQFTHHAEIAGTLAYLAPEQTGRTSRPVDQRADLYGLGATLYELATGRPPFGTGDPLRLTHDHLARVPVPPSEVNPGIPESLSAIIMHLLEKEPDDRYQTADGLVHDLGQWRAAGASPRVPAPRIGERDFPPRLLPPSRLVGRDGEVAALQAAFEDAVAGRCRGVLVSGSPGVGKTALVNELRPAVTATDGWFVAGKFDPYRRDLEFDAFNQAFRALGRLLLAGPEDDLADVRTRILEAAGPNAGLLTAAVPEFAALLGVPADPGDPLTAQVRSQLSAAQVLRAVAARKRPVVLFTDDLQWAGLTPLGLADLMLSEEPIEGLLLVGAYREEDVDPAHPLTALLTRWREQDGVRHLRLANLPESGSVAMIAEMLRVSPATAAGLAGVISRRTRGNPYDTVELLNLLRRDGLLTVTASGWRWDGAAVGAHLSRPEAAGPPSGRATDLPPATRQMVEAMACLGGRTELSLLQAAAGEPASVVEQRLAPALGAGVLVMESGPEEAVRFGHDRIREVILDGLDPRRRRTLQLTMARRLAGAPAWFAVAAEQYLPVIEEVEDAGERRQVAGLLRRAAGQAALIGDYALVNALLSAALPLVDPGDTATLADVHTARHAALFCLGRLEEADEEYRAIERLRPAPLDRAAATAVQITSLTHATRKDEAVSLALQSMRALGIAVPATDQAAAELGRQLEYLYQWLDQTDAADDLTRPELTDPALIAATRLIDAVLTAVYLIGDVSLYAWLSLEALRVWLRHGPGRTLIGPASIAAFAVVAMRGDYAASYRALRRLVAVGEARGYDPATSRVRLPYAIMACWFEPLENGVQAGQLAREGLAAGGDLANVGYTYYATVCNLLDCAPSLDAYVAEADAGLAFARRTGSEQTIQWLDSYRWLAGVLRGENSVAGGEPDPAERYPENPQAQFHAHLCHAVVAALFDDPAGLAQHTAAAMPLLPMAVGTYPSALAHLLRGLALAGQARAADGGERERLLAEHDEVTQWLADRAADAPDNFLHLLRLLEAERARATGDFRVAALAFDAARREAARRQRHWHQALITERAARFYLDRSLDQAGYDLLAQARQQYRAWGATAKAAQLDWAYPALRPRPDASATVTTGTVDLLGILSASLALSSETSIERLHGRVVEVLSAMTGATGVDLVLWNDDGHEWLLPGPDRGTDAVAAPGHEHHVPMSVLRYVQRTNEALVLGDAARDDRFARDPYFADAGHCSLLAVPIFGRGALRAVLLLENRLLRGAFTAERLDAVKLIAGQLAVSLDNAQLYAELTASRARIVAAHDQARRRFERDLHDGAQQRLVSLELELRAARAALPPEFGPQLDEAIAEAAGALEELRETARGIHPPALAKGGLEPALKVLARRSPVRVDLDFRAGRHLPEHAEVSAYYFVAEALTNVAKHAGASAVTVTAETDSADDVLRVTVRDNGAGGADFTRGTGLTGLKDRVEAVGGRLLVDSPPGAGTTLRAEIPLTKRLGLPCSPV
jgi:predicted ATPase/signal transduction histidine kinase